MLRVALQSLFELEPTRFIRCFEFKRRHMGARASERRLRR
jgi:hypothetical protein